MALLQGSRDAAAERERDTMRPATLICLTGDDGDANPDASEAAARRALPGVTFGQIVILDELEVGGWVRAHRGRRCRTARDIARCPERQQPVVLDADLPPGAW